jgi:hypothetical protein
MNDDIAELDETIGQLSLIEGPLAYHVEQLARMVRHMRRLIGEANDE